MDVYDEACQAIRLGLSAYAVAVMDPSQFHLFYPSLQNSSTGGTSARDRSTSGPIRSTTSKSPRRTGSGRRSPNPTTEAILTDETDIYAQTRRAKETCSVADSLAPSRTPQVLFMHSRPRGSKALQNRHQDGVSRPPRQLEARLNSPSSLPCWDTVVRTTTLRSTSCPRPPCARLSPTLRQTMSRWVFDCWYQRSDPLMIAT
jgi:hypothetical protein